jgi:hypothetical protein
MADPRAFTIVCPKNEGGKTGDKRSFFNAVGKIGDIQALNDIGASKIGAGLRTLNSVSNAVRGGCGSIPASIANSLDAGANWVLSNVGIAPSVIDSLSRFNPGVANQAYGQAKQLFQQVKQGNFKLKDIPGYAQDFQALASLGGRIFTPKPDKNKAIEICAGTSPYAIDLLVRAPKYKFLFIVQIVMNDPYTEIALENELTYVVKTATRPSIKYITEDVNYYNFRSKVATKAEFDEMTMTFHDDTGFGKGSGPGSIERGNNAVRFYNTYMRAMSPITNYSHVNQLDDIKRQGMDFGFPLVDDDGNVVEELGNNPQPAGTEIIEGSVIANKYAASLGTLQKNSFGSDIDNMIREIKIFHVYDFGHHLNVYKFYNPRITTMKLDDLDMAASTEGCELSVSFNYDTVFIETGISMKDLDLSDVQRYSLYPLRYNAASDGKPLPPRSIKPFGTPTAVPDKCSPKTK